MLEDFDLKQIREPLLSWYEKEKRDLPWRSQVTPYRVWVSEIMLQQTRVEAVKPYFARFMEALPTIKDLAECPEEKLLKLWEGLGYYNRVRNMQLAAQTIMEQYDGQMPEEYEQILSLKGIGSYTAGAIASAAFGKPVPAVDGNVLRVIMRLTADDADILKQSVKKQVEERIKEIIPAENASSFNQALMELGAIVCVPNGAPLCDRCPWQDFCQTKKEGLWQQIPVKKKAKERRIENKTILIIRDEDKVVLRKRPKRGLLAGMYEFPNFEGHLCQDEALLMVSDMNLAPLHIQKLESAKHIFSHVEWHMEGYMIRVDSLTREEADLLFVDTKDSEEHYPIPAAFVAYTKYMNIRLGNERFE